MWRYASIPEREMLPFCVYQVEKQGLYRPQLALGSPSPAKGGSQLTQSLSNGVASSLPNSPAQPGSAASVPDDLWVQVSPQSSAD